MHVATGALLPSIVDVDTLTGFPKIVPQLERTRANIPALHQSSTGRRPEPAAPHNLGFRDPLDDYSFNSEIGLLEVGTAPLDDDSNGRWTVTFGEPVSQMARLETISISNCLSNALVASSAQPTILPHVQFLSLEDSIAPLVAYLQSSAAFHARRVALTISDPPLTIESITIDSHSQHLSGGVYGEELSQCLVCRTLWKDPATGAHVHRAQTGIQGLALKGLHFKGRQRTSNRVFWLDAWYHPFESKAKPDLRISLSWLTVEVSDCYCLEATWRDAIAPLPNLTTIKFLEGDILGFASVMAAIAEPVPRSTPTSSTLETIRGAPLFPALSTIILREVREYAAQFALVLKRWPKMHSLREPHVGSCTNFIEDDFDFFVRCAPNVTVKWDGVEDEQECMDEGSFAEQTQSVAIFGAPIDH
ncbi:hypothetical protein FA13DRAFT_1704837 [Coprinellus micaceus]|uniref:Uncharacterized protein n=1 Tax=Coprinellus micaceus TaxID=71717 RepID=A0A4Y7TYT1_COPMI|nr:hypothetical protein FA13DRAFT_1704837 [Coprinellus micaceus]